MKVKDYIIDSNKLVLNVRPVGELGLAHLITYITKDGKIRSDAMLYFTGYKDEVVWLNL